jgi:hypothetical protein
MIKEDWPMAPAETRAKRDGMYIYSLLMIMEDWPVGPTDRRASRDKL